MRKELLLCPIAAELLQAKVSIKEGQECMKSDPPDYDKAARCFTRAGQLDPDNHLIYLQRGQAHEAAGRIEKAEKDAERTLFRKKDFAPVRVEGEERWGGG